MSQSQAIATRPSNEVDIADLSDDPEWKQLATKAKLLARTELVPDRMRNKPAEVMAGFLTCQALDLEPNIMTLSQLYNVKGTPGLSAQLQLGMAHAAGFTSDWKTKNDNDQVAALEMPEGSGKIYNFTITMARAANLVGKDTYKQYVCDMLRARATTRAIKGCCPEVLLGLRRAAPELFQTVTGAAELPDDDIAVAEIVPDGEPFTDETEPETATAPESVPVATAKIELVAAAVKAGLSDAQAKALAQKVWGDYRLPAKDSAELVQRRVLDVVLKDLAGQASAMVAPATTPDAGAAPAEEPTQLFGGATDAA